MKKSNLIIKVLKIFANAFKNLKFKSKCCNSECLNKESIVIVENESIE